MDNRKSRRTYTEEDIDGKDVKILKELIDSINKGTKLNIQYIKDGKDDISGFKASYGMISNAKSFIALVGDKNIRNYKEKLGYYGESIVLEATNLKLGTCWIGGTYKKEECKKYIEFKDNEELVCIIAIGNVDKNLSIKEKLVKTLNKNEKSFNDILISHNKEIPSWVKVGIDCTAKAPSALNKKIVAYKLKDNKVEAKIMKKNHGYEKIDLGISMLHFQLGAYSEGYMGRWKYENGGYIFY
nr:nitroreductase family protein [[Clostridium] dakarense]